MMNDPLYDYDSANNLAAACDAASEQSEEKQEKLDPKRFKAYVETPDKIPEERLNQLVAIIDGKYSSTPKDADVATRPVPATIDRLLNSDTVVYICDAENGNTPVAVATIVDPTQESYQGFRPVEIYSLLTDKNFDGMLQQEFFAVDEGYRGMGLGTELRAQIAKLGITTFTVVDADDRETMVGMINNGYEMVAVVPDDGSGHPVQIWVG